jgi:Protein of unknown function (DUF3455)
LIETATTTAIARAVAEKNAMIIRVASALFILGTVPALADQAAVAPPVGAPLLVEAQADGVQIYACEATDKGPEWVFKAPEANLFDAKGRQIGTHFAGPGWKLVDGSEVTAAVFAKANASVPGAVPWLLLEVKTHDGAGSLAAATTIRRTDTKGGAAPTTGCDANHLGEQARMRYSATYQFFGATK